MSTYKSLSLFQACFSSMFFCITCSGFPFLGREPRFSQVHSPGTETLSAALLPGQGTHYLVVLCPQNYLSEFWISSDCLFMDRSPLWEHLDMFSLTNADHKHGVEYSGDIVHLQPSLICFLSPSLRAEGLVPTLWCFISLWLHSHALSVHSEMWWVSSTNCPLPGIGYQTHKISLNYFFLKPEVLFWAYCQEKIYHDKNQ